MSLTLEQERNDALINHGSQSKEYRRANTRLYRATNVRVEYYPGREACKVLEQASEERWALSNNDAINQALTFWRDWQTGEFENDGEQ